MTTTSKHLRRKHRKNPKPRLTGRHPSHTSGLEQLRALEAPYIFWKSHRSSPEVARAEWKLLVFLLESYASFAPFEAPDDLDLKTFAALTNSIREQQDAVTSHELNVLDCYLHFLNDNGRWHHQDDDFERLHMLVLLRVPARGLQRISRVCPIDLPTRSCHGIAIAQWAAYLLDEMIAGKFVPNSTKSLAFPVTEVAGTAILAPGLHPFPLARFLDLQAAMDSAGLFESIEIDEDWDDKIWDKEEEFEESDTTKWQFYPTGLGLALLEDDHPQNREAVCSLLTAYLRILVMGIATPASSTANLRRATAFMSMLLDLVAKPTAAKTHGETNVLALGDDTTKRVKERFGEITGPVLSCLASGILEEIEGALAARSIVREAIKELHNEYVG